MKKQIIIILVLLTIIGCAGIIYATGNFDKVVDKVFLREETEKIEEKKTLTIEEKRDNQRIADLQIISNALNEYANQNEKTENPYPISNGLEKISEEANSVFKTLKENNCLKQRIKDPLSPKYFYGYKSDGKTYELTAILEDKNNTKCEIENNLCVYKIGNKQEAKKNICFGGCLLTNEKTATWADFEDLETGDIRENIYLLKVPEGEIIKINKDPTHILSTILSEEKVVWVESKNDYDNWEMHIYDIQTEESKKLMPIRAREYHEHKDKIVFKKTIDDHNPNQELIIYDIHKKEMTKLFNTSTGYSCFTGRKNQIIFRERGKFYLYNLDANKKEPLPEELNISASCLNIYEDNIVYSKFTGRKGEEKESLKDDPNIAIHGDVIGMGPDWYAGIDNLDSGLKIFVYNLSTKKTKELKEITVPKIHQKGFNGMLILGLRIIKDEVKYIQKITKWTGPDISAEVNKCVLIDINTGEEKDITCEGNILK